MSLFALRHANRLREVLRALVVHGYGHIAERLPLPFRLPFTRSSEAQSRSALARETREAFEELGPTFVKIGQMLSTRPDLLPAEFIDEFEKLQMQASQVSLKDVNEVLRDELGRDPGDVFSDFTPDPIASASMAQVHRAVYRGQEVAVKVQRPGIDELIEKDTEIIIMLADLIDEHIRGAESYNLPQLAREFSRNMKKELDFSREADSIRRFRREFADCSKVIIPQVFADVSTQRVLTLRRIDGKRPDELKGLTHEQRNRLAHLALNVCFQQIFSMGMFHADPHPGNLLIVQGEKLALLDFGTVGLVDEDTKNDLSDVLLGVLDRDYDVLLDVLLEISRTSPASVDRQRMKRELMEIVEYNLDKSLSNLQVGEIIYSLMQLLQSHKITMPWSYAALLRAMAVAESTGRMIYPDLNLAEEVKPYVRDALVYRWMPDRWGPSLVSRTSRLLRQIVQWPRQITAILDRAEKGELVLQFRHVGLDSFMRGLEKIAYRLIAGLIMASLIVGGSLIIGIDRPPFLFGYSVLGIFSYFAAAVLGVWLLWQGRR